MISLAFINGEEEPIIANDPYIQFQSLLYESSCEIDNMIKSLIDKSNSIYMESEIMGSIDNEKLVVMEAEKSNVFEKLGNAVIKIFEKLSELIQSVLNKIKAFFTKDKNELDKIDELLKKHPQLKDEIIVAWKQGDLKVADAKSLKEMDDAFNELIKMANDNSVDPNTFQGKVNEFKKKFEHIDESTTVKVANSVNTVIKAVSAVVAISFLFKESKKRLIDLNDSIVKDKDAMVDNYARMKNYENGDYVGGLLTKWQQLKNAYYFKNKNYTKMIKKEEGMIDKCNKGIFYFLNKHWKQEARDYNTNMDIAVKLRQNEKRNEIRDEQRKAYRVKMAQHAADRNYETKQSKKSNKNKNNS